jgi:hypothetical protein
MENDIKPTPHSEPKEEPKSDETTVHSSHDAAKSHAVEPAKKSVANDLKKAFLFVLVGGLVISAVIAVIAVLVGEFNEMTWRALGTTMSIVFHALAGLLFYSMSSGSDDKNVNEVYINTIMGVVVASFATSVFSLWEVLTGPIIGDLYAVYFYTFVFSTLAKILYSVARADKVTRALSNTSMGFTGLMYLLVLPPLFYDYPNELPDVYYRILAAVAIVLGTTSVLTAIFNRLYLNKHPELTKKDAGHGTSPLTIVLYIIIGIFAIPMLFWLFGWIISSASR